MHWLSLQLSLSRRYAEDGHAVWRILFINWQHSLRLFQPHEWSKFRRICDLWCLLYSGGNNRLSNNTQDSFGNSMDYYRWTSLIKFEAVMHKKLIFVVSAVTGISLFAVPPPPPHHHHSNRHDEVLHVVGAGVELLDHAVNGPREKVVVVTPVPPSPQPVIIYENTPPPPRPVVVHHAHPPPPRPVIVHHVSPPPVPPARQPVIIDSPKTPPPMPAKGPEEHNMATW